MDFKIIQFVFLFFANLAPLRDKLFSYSPLNFTPSLSGKAGMGFLLQDIQDLNLISKYKYKTTLAKALSTQREY